MSSNYNRKDKFYERAKEAGYRSRAAYKLCELDDKFKLLKPGATILDLGCWPGGWLQVAAERVGPSGLVIGVDLVATEPLPATNVCLLTGDARDEEIQAQILALAPGGVDVLISDMSPKLTGIREADQAGTVACAELALWFAGQILAAGGSAVMKVFKGNETEQFVKTMRPVFNKVSREELDATRKTSNEYYLVGTGYRKKV